MKEEISAIDVLHYNKHATLWKLQELIMTCGLLEDSHVILDCILNIIVLIDLLTYIYCKCRMETVHEWAVSAESQDFISNKDSVSTICL